MRKVIIIAAALLALSSTLAIYAADAKAKGKDAKEVKAVETEKVFTAEELAKYNGKNGSKSYVAYDGLVYDVTDVPAWKTGSHKGNQAGQDITSLIKKSPHGDKVFKKQKPIGKFAAGAAADEKNKGKAKGK